MVTSPTNIHLIQQPIRFPQPIWKSYIDNNPWTFTTPANTPSNHENIPIPPQALPLPPDPKLREWRGRCYNCLDLGHDQNDCPSQERTCAKCWQTGHEARMYNYSPVSKPSTFDPLVPRGNLGDKEMPKNRPNMSMCFVPETNQMQHNSSEMNGPLSLMRASGQRTT